MKKVLLAALVLASFAVGGIGATVLSSQPDAVQIARPSDTGGRTRNPGITQNSDVLCSKVCVQLVPFRVGMSSYTPPVGGS